MKKKIIPLALLVFFTGCAELERIAEQIESPGPLTNQEVINGLRQALVIGSDSAATSLSKVGGYYHDKSVRVMLPPEADIITDNLSLIPGGEKIIKDLIFQINRAAEDAAREAAPVFASAVRTMSIQDGFTILRGEDDAATQYLRSRTWNELYNLYQPKIKRSIDKPFAGNISPGESWNTLAAQWNRIADSPVGRMSDLNPVNVELDRYLTNKALNGLFLKLAQEEKKIRTDPAARVTALLERVFKQQ